MACLSCLLFSKDKKEKFVFIKLAPIFYSISKQKGRESDSLWNSLFAEIIDNSADKVFRYSNFLCFHYRTPFCLWHRKVGDNVKASSLLLKLNCCQPQYQQKLPSFKMFVRANDWPELLFIYLYAKSVFTLRKTYLLASICEYMERTWCSYNMYI